MRASMSLRYIPLLVCGLAVAGLETGWSGALPPIFPSPALAGLGVAIAGLAAMLCGALYAAGRSGRLANRSRSLAVFELGCGLSAVSAFFLLAGIEQPIAALNGGFRGAGPASAIGLALVFAIILVPCFLAGAAVALHLGVVSPARHRAGAAAYGLAAFFLGLAAGQALFGSVVVPRLGVRAALLCGAGAWIAAGSVWPAWGRLVARLTGQPGSEGTAPQQLEFETPPAAAPGAAGLYALTGALTASAVACALAWTRVCQQAAGAVPHTSAATAAVLLAFTGLGLLTAGRVERRIGGARSWVGLGAAAAGAVWMVPLRLADDLPFVFVRASASHYALALAVFLVPGLLLGAALALAAGALQAGAGNGSRRIGGCFAAVVAGAVIALAAGLLIPSRLIGLRAAASLAPWPAIAGGVWLSAAGPSRVRRLMLTGIVAAAALAGSLTAPAWNPGILSSGVYTYAEDVGDLERLRATLRGADVPYVSGDRGRMISVLRSPDGLMLRETGKTVATTGADLPSQMLAAHIPLAICESPRRVLVLGLGTGLTVGSASSHPVERIDCVEPHPSVAAAARYFAPYNRQALADPRVDLIITEPANYLLLSRDVYDVIVSRQVYSAEVVRLARARLSATGIFCQVLDLNALSEESARYLARETAVYFPSVALWWIGGSRLMVTGSMASLRVESETLRDRLADPRVMRDLGRLETMTYTGLLSFYLMGRDGLLSWAAYAPPYSRDRDFLAYADARPQVRDNPQVMAELDRRHENPSVLLADLDPENVDYTIVDSHLARATDARSSYFKSLAAARDGRFREASAYIENARGNCPENGLFVVEASDFYVSASRAFAQANRPAEALDAARRALTLRPGNARAFYNLATLEMRRDPTTAAALLRQATELDPAYLPAYLLQAEAEIAAGLLGPAGETISRALSLAPLDLRAYHLRGICSMRAGRAAEARADFERILDAEPRNAAALSAMAYTWLLEDNLEKAQRYYQRALNLSPEDPEALNSLATVLAEREQYQRALELWEKALRLDPGNQDIQANLEEVRRRMSGS